MQKRHRIPTIFSIYMVDVLCCALGCVILLWQVNYQGMQEQTARAEAQTTLAQENEASALAALEQLKNANFSVDSMSTKIKTLTDELAAKNKRLVQVTLELQETIAEKNRKEKLALVYKNDYDNAKKAEAMLAALLDSERAKYKDLVKEKDLTAADLAEKIRLGKDMLRQIAALEKDLKKRQGEVLASATKLDETNAMLSDTQARNKKLESLVTQMQTQGKDYQLRLTEFDLRSKLLEQDLDRSRKDLLDSRNRTQEFMAAHKLLSMRLQLSSKELEDARALAAVLQTDKVSLLDMVKNIRLAADKRFAGITLTGRRVIFLVDMSGSMDFVEGNLKDPDKWPLVCETVAKVMASLPDLRQYQVILFSDRARYPLGEDGQWIAYNPTSSPKEVVKALKDTKPKGETNMYSAFAEAFSYRDVGNPARGLDTIYVFSDGLPTAGEGLPANAGALNESQRTEVLGKYLRTRLKSVWNRPVNSERVRINTIGFFYESPDVGAFLWALAREHDGSFVGMSRP